MGRYIVWGTGLLPMMIVVLTTFVLPLGAAAQRPGHVPRIAFLDLGFPPSPPASTPFLDAFRAGLRERGWTEGHNLAIEWRWAEGSLDRFATLVAEMIRLQFVSQMVIDEASAGDPEAATRRLEVIASLPLLDPQTEGIALAQILSNHLSLPPRAAADALHIAIAVVNGMDYLLTWNCTHIANAALRGRIEAACRRRGFSVPIICTPEELLEA